MSEYRETTREEVIAQARASAEKLGCDPDLLELMAIRIWDASMETAATKVAQVLHRWNEKKSGLEHEIRDLKRLPAYRTPDGRVVIRTIERHLDGTSQWLREALRQVERSR